MGLESPNSGYDKLKGAYTLRITQELRGNGIKLLGSTIVGLEHHTPENVLMLLCASGYASVREHRALHLLVSLHTGKGTARAEHMSLQSVELSVMGWKQLC
jgi:hypothetical protein